MSEVAPDHMEEKVADEAAEAAELPQQQHDHLGARDTFVRSEAAPDTAPVVPVVQRKRKVEVIELLDDDDEDDEPAKPPPPAKKTPLQRAEEAHQRRVQQGLPHNIQVGQALGVPASIPPPSVAAYEPTYTNGAPLDTPQYIPFPKNFVPTWHKLLPTLPPPPPKPANSFQHFELSLLNINQFTIQGMPVYTMRGVIETSVSGLRGAIKKIAKDHGGRAFWSRDKDEGGGKWRIPLAAYQALFTYLSAMPNTKVDGISARQLDIASLERARQEKGYPTVQKLREMGIPKGLAEALAPFQRGGVDFVVEKNGRALIADDMGLGKTIQAIASMAVYRNEWPVLVLTPSSARYHWENEFKHWLSRDSALFSKENAEEDHINDAAGNLDETDTFDATDAFDEALIEASQINVLGSSKDAVLPDASTMVVICSYGLAPTLVSSGRITPSMFRCAIVDESHMLKSKSTQRTKTLLPVLSATVRCVLLSGTPALSRPMELWPQVSILQSAESSWFNDEAAFIQKYVKRGSVQSRAELHTMLTGTVMIRRLKADILKTLPSKVREKASVRILSREQQARFRELLEALREGTGALGKIARSQHAAANAETDGHTHDMDPDFAAGSPIPREAQEDTAESVEESLAYRKAMEELETEKGQELIKGRADIVLTLQQYQMDETRRQELFMQMTHQLEDALERQFEARKEQIRELQEFDLAEAKKKRRANALNKLYCLTGEAKIPLLVDMLNRWLNDPTKGKVCIFAHHLSVLDAIRDRSDLRNGEDHKFIRIDGSTSPLERQRQINAFQTDPSIRVALLGITAAGVAVTLTASSTVWFAELFWTPAIMIQAEDRVHRIGQQAEVKCLYVVAKGTIDDVLWKLIENKFRALGEFVEGKEKQKIVVSKTFEKIAELHAMFSTLDEDEEDDLAFVGDDDIQFDSSIFDDIERLGQEEQLMLKVKDEDGDGDAADSDGSPAVDDGDRKPSAVVDNGQTENDAIVIVDDDDDTPSVDGHTASAAKADESTLFSDARMYTISCSKAQLGLCIVCRDGRVIVSGPTEDRAKDHGPESRPRRGDILAAVRGRSVPLVHQLSDISPYLKHALQNPPTELTFIESPSFTEHFNWTENMNAAAAGKPVAASKSNNNDVIEID